MKGIAGARFKKFASLSEAEAFAAQGSGMCVADFVFVEERTL